jgi:hypothetical protein
LPVLDRRQLEPVADIDLDMAALRESHYMLPILGTMPAANVARMHTVWPAFAPFLIAMTRKTVVWLAGAQDPGCHRAGGQGAYLEPLNLPALQGSREIIGELTAKLRGTHDCGIEATRFAQGHIKRSSG